MSEPLAISMRPRTFEGMIGADKLIKRIRTRVEKRVPHFMLAGQTGCGKTTLARIIALSLQCRHQKVFGNPCKSCQKRYKTFDINDMNMPDIGVSELRERLSSVYLYPMPGSRRKIFILDEAHMMSKSAQNLLLKYTEDCPRRTRFMICTTEPSRIIRTLRRRFAIYTVPDLEMEDVRHLVQRGLKRIGSELNSSDLVERLMEKNLTSAALILNAVEKYSDGCTPEEAVEVDVATSVDTKAMCRSVIKGMWDDTAKLLSGATDDDGMAIKVSIMGYLKAILVNGEESSRANVVADGILRLQQVSDLPSISAVLYKLCKRFK